MTDKLKSILYEINKLDSSELDVLYNEMLHKMRRGKKANLFLKEFIEEGKGFWKSDAQEYVNKLRNDPTLMQ